MLIDIIKQGKIVKRVDRVLGGLSWDNELMYVPSLDLTLPIEYLDYFDGREDVLIHVNNKVFFGHVKNNITINKAEETIRVPLSHIISEWEYRQISVNDAIAEGSVNAVFKGDKTKKSAKNDEGITASDFSLLSKEVKKLTNAKAIRKAGAHAWNTNNGDPVEITKVDYSKVKAKDGEYKVTFETAKGTSVTINVTVNANVKMGGERTNRDGKEKKIKITARQFTINIESAELTDGQLIKISKAKAWKYRKPDDEIPVKVQSNGIRPQVGEYQVVFSATRDGKTATVQITVTVEETQDPPAPDVEPTIIDQIEDIYDDANFAYPGWTIDYEDDDAKNRVIEYVYSRQNKLEALTKTMELTTDLFWRVVNTAERRVEIGKFGQKKPYTISLKPSGKTNRRIISEPEITKDFENVINVATVYSDKSDSGMSSLTLREVLEEKEDEAILKLKEKFPVVILRANVNNERDYTRYAEIPKIAPNNQYEYAVIDTESVALESGILIEGTYAFNDLGAFNTEGKKITDGKRKRASRTAYRAAIRRLRQARRNYKMTVTVEEMPTDVNVGDRIRLIYDNSIWKLDSCSNYWKKVLTHDDWFYIEKISWDIDELGNETNTLTLTKYIRVERETDNQQ